MNTLKSYFGVFTFDAPEKPKLVWTGELKKNRIETCPCDNQNDNRMGVISVFGREVMHQGEIGLAEICPLSQNTMDDRKVGDTLLVKSGTYAIGKFEIMYIGKYTG